MKMLSGDVVLSFDWARLVSIVEVVAILVANLFHSIVSLEAHLSQLILHDDIPDIFYYLEAH
jgi:hypothetical protein